MTGQFSNDAQSSHLNKLHGKLSQFLSAVWQHL